MRRLSRDARWRSRIALASALVSLVTIAPADAAEPVVTIAGAPSVVYNPALDACAPNDQPDMNPRAFRDAAGQTVVFALHFVNRPLRGPDLDHIKIDCHVSLDSPLDGDPAHFADRFYVASTWTRDGRDVGALIHEEYHADEHERCAFKDSLACWYNTILAFHSTDGGTSFTKMRPEVVAAAPFTQDVDQGRHRGFFEPSNMFGDGRFVYAFVSTTGWLGQDAGSCLFRSSNPSDSASWRAYDGAAFTVRYVDPYRRGGAPAPKPCKVIAPFSYAVGSVVRHASSKKWLAFFQAAAGGAFPVEGFYYASSDDLLHWEPARLLLAGRTLFGDWCKAGDTALINYPSVLDARSPSRNFDTIGDHPTLFFTSMQAHACQTSGRLLARMPLDVRVTNDRADILRKHERVRRRS